MTKRSDPKATPASLRVVGPDTEVARILPPDGLGPVATALWVEIVRDYEFSDPGSVATLRQACFAVDLAERCRQEIERLGIVTVSRNGTMRANPAAQSEIQARALACRLLARLGLDLEPLRSGPGRPAGARGG
jgi:phage terminase small subunit